MIVNAETTKQKQRNMTRDINKKGIDEQEEWGRFYEAADNLKFSADNIKTAVGIEFLNFMQDINDNVKSMNKNYNNIAGREVF